MPGQQHGTRVCVFIKAHANFYFAEQKFKTLIYLTISQNCCVVAIKTSAIKQKYAWLNLFQQSHVGLYLCSMNQQQILALVDVISAGV